jgi:hypothetical protein
MAWGMVPMSLIKKQFGKYVTGFLKHDKIGLEAAILLPTYVEHSAVKDLFKEIIGAGFYTVEACKTNNLNVKVYGESESLNLRPSEFDVDYVKLALGN